MTAKNTKVQAKPCEEKAVSEFSKRRMTRDERLYRALLEPASTSRFEKRPDWAHWYCVSVVGGTEFALEGKLSKAGVEVFVVRERGVVVNKGRKIEFEKPMFKNYVFVRILPLADAFHALLTLSEVRGFLGDGTRYHVISNEHMSVFKGSFEKKHVERMPVDRSIGQGQEVSIVHGPFAGFNCVVLQVSMKRDARARVWIDAFGKPFEIESIPVAFLQKL